MQTVIDYRFDRIIRLISMLAISLLFASYMRELVTYYLPLSGLLAIIFSLAFFFAGFGLQCLAAKLFFIERTKSDGSYENTESFFRKKDAKFAILLSIIPAISAAILLNLFINKSDAYYYYAVIPFAAAALGFAISISGVVIWFYPSRRLCDRRAILICMLLYLILYLAGVLLMNKYVAVIGLITDTANTMDSLRKGGELNLFPLGCALVTFIALKAAQIADEKHYAKLNAMMAERAADK